MRSQRHLRARDGVDSAGWGGSVLSTVNSLPLGGVSPGGGSLAVNLSNVNGPLAGVTITAVSANPGIATIDASAVTNANGDASFTEGWVAAGTTSFSLTYEGAPHVTSFPVVVT